MSVLDYGTMRDSTSSAGLYLIVACLDTGKVGYQTKLMHTPYWRWKSEKDFLGWLKKYSFWRFSPAEEKFEGNV